jgi:hypothetical protein
MKLRPAPAPEPQANGTVHHALGVHLNQRHADYILDEGLGYGAIVDLFHSAPEWWDASANNPLRDKSVDADKTKAFADGTALHTRSLDGLAVYNRTYAVAPTAASHPDYLDTIEQLKDACRALRLSTAGDKGTLIHTLVKAKAKVKILRVAQDKFARSGKLPISQAVDFRIKLLHRMMMRTRQELKMIDGSGLTLRAAMTGGLKEISVYWVDAAGIRHRARFDMLKPNFTGDLKSISKWKKSNFTGALLEEMIFRGYIVQHAHYDEARRALRIAVNEGRIYGATERQLGWLKEIAEADEWAFVNVFAKMDGAPQVKGIVIRRESGQFIKAVTQRETALANYIFHRDYHGGLDKPWFDTEVVIEPAETDWPQFSELGQ